MKTRLFFKFVQATLFVTATWGIGAATAHAAPCSVPTAAHPMIQSAVSDPGCDPINVAPGPYTENVIISRSLTLNGAQAGNSSRRTNLRRPGRVHRHRNDHHPGCERYHRWFFLNESQPKHGYFDQDRRQRRADREQYYLEELMRFT